MPRHFLKRLMPDPASIRGHTSLRFLGKLLHDPNLWHVNRRSVARAMAVGLFAAFLPIPLQMLAAACMAIPVKANMPIAAGLVWITNPLTMPLLFYCTYKVGGWLLGMPPQQWPEQLSMERIGTQFAGMWLPFLLGSMVTGLVMGALGYASTMLYWRWRVSRQWQRRSHRRP